jgi:transposase
MTTLAERITGGVDSHLDVHVVAALSATGALLGVASFPTTPAGYRQLLRWLRSFGEVVLVGVEGTGSYGAGLTRYLLSAGIDVARSTGPTASAGAGEASPILRTQSPLLGRHCPETLPARPRPATEVWKPYGC